MISFNARPFALTIALLCSGFTFAGTPALAPASAQEQEPAQEPKQEQKQAPKVTLKVGDAAPELSIATWWQDKKLAELQKNRVYLVDFWASWCPPCRESFPEIAKMRAKYASEGLEVVAVSTDEDVDAAAQFLNTQGGKFDFFVGIDKKEASWTSWGTAAGRTTIPSSFLVDSQGKILWIGHPMEEELEPLILKAIAEIPLDSLPVTPKA